MPLHTILLEHVHIDGDAFCFPVESVEPSPTGDKSVIRHIRVSCGEFRRLISIFYALEFEEEDQPVDGATR